MVYFTPSKVRFLSYNIHGDCRDRKEFFRYEAAMSMQKKEGCDTNSLRRRSLSDRKQSKAGKMADMRHLV